MFVALDIDKKRVHANNAYVNGDWRCPSCGKLLTYKKGQIRRAYFAHRKSNICTDTWSTTAVSIKRTCSRLLVRRRLTSHLYLHFASRRYLPPTL